MWWTVALVLLAGCSGGPGGSPYGDGGTDDGTQEDSALTLTSPAFEDGATIPTRFTCDGADASPALDVGQVPDQAETLALIVDDPDAPREEPWVHWLIWDVPATAERIPEGYPPSGDGGSFDQARQGANSFSSDDVRYRGPCPPEGHGEHRYRFTLHAVDTRLGLDGGADREALEAALDGHVLETTRLVGVYER